MLVLGCSQSSARPLCPHGGSCPHPQCFWPWQQVISGHALQVPWELCALPCTWSSRAWRTHSACRSPPHAPPHSTAAPRGAGVPLASKAPTPAHAPRTASPGREQAASAGLCADIMGQERGVLVPPPSQRLGAGGFATRSLCHFCGSPRLWQLRACWGRVHLVGASGTPMEVPWLGAAVRWTDGQTDVPLSGCPLLPAVPGAAALPPEQAGQVPDHSLGAGASRLH